MTMLDQLKARLDAKESRLPPAARLWLERENPKPISTQPASVTAHQALRVWRVRLKTARAQHRGMSELVHHLEEMTPQSKVEQFSFQGKDSTALLFFKKRDGEFLGSIFVETTKR